MILENLKLYLTKISNASKPEPQTVASHHVAVEDPENLYDASELEFESVVSNYRSLENDKADKLFKYCVVAALIFHFSLILAIPYFQQFASPNQILKPGEKVTQVRLVEPQEPQKQVEPPPKEASAISDRDHTAEKQRLPKIPPVPKAPIGHIDAQNQRTASLIPPDAPESPQKADRDTKEKKEPEEDQKKRNSQQRSETVNKKIEKETPVEQSRPHNSKRKKIDLRPTPQEIAKGLSRVPGANDFFPEGDVEEAVVDINTREDTFYSYMLHLKKKIEGVWVYPSAAAKSGLGGSLALEFSIAKDGQLLYVNLLDSSGHTILDESAIRAIKTAAPYFPFPPRLQAKRLKIRANFIYITSNYLRNIM
ncbi:MAG: TonB family protein [Desulfomonilaceae bacterium]